MAASNIAGDILKNNLKLYFVGKKVVQLSIQIVAAE
jgi:hypothetical protein